MKRITSRGETRWEVSTPVKPPVQATKTAPRRQRLEASTLSDPKRRKKRRSTTAVHSEPLMPPLDDIVDDHASPPAEYEVGRGKPPKRTQFKKGRSGNPKGRPKGSKNLATIFESVLAGRMRVTLGGETRTLSRKDVAVFQLVTQAIQGDQRALFKLFDLIGEFERRQAANQAPEYDITDADLKVMRAIHARMPVNQGEPSQ